MLTVGKFYKFTSETHYASKLYEYSSIKEMITINNGDLVLILKLENYSHFSSIVKKYKILTCKNQQIAWINICDDYELSWESVFA